jgi:hypothetical protein
MRGIQVGGLAGVHHRPAADRHVAVEAAVRGEPRGFLERNVVRLDPDLVVDGDVDAGRRERRP